uniref:C2H2-type domain-containing protein n=1 Tax=Mycena chlorophos TaxID=658473 RepID=A0ABQ0L7I0_MYCCL|nr:predicted protein [Mycena chlorophos]
MDVPYDDPDVDADGELDQLDAQTAPAVAVTTLAAASGVTKRYRPAQTKTWVCRGFGQCSMSFSRSEHLARHIRKHTGERPFNCHCGKQFSRLDNLRQHAQTVHADKPAENETMMRQLANLHASITGQVPSPPLPTTGTTAAAPKATRAAAKAARKPSTKRAKQAAVKVEDENVSISLAPQRPAGNEGAAGSMDVDVEPKQEPQPSPPLAARGSFRGDGDSSHSFRNNNSNNTDVVHDDQSFRAGQSQSFRGQAAASTHTIGSANTNSLPALRVPSGIGGGVPSSDSGGNTSRPGTSNGSGPPLPPLSSVVSAANLAFRRPSTGAGVSASSISATNANSILFPNSLTLRRPSTATSDWAWDGFGSRPGTAPGKLATAFPGAGGISSADDSSPFSFHVPDQPAATAATYNNPRKRALGSAHGPYGAYPDDDCESQSRPTSRRVSVMELIRDDNGADAVRPVSVSAALAIPRGRSRDREWEQRPITTNGLISRASALDLSDDGSREREPRQRFAFQAQPQSVAAGGFGEYGGGGGSRPGSVRGRVEAPAGAAAGAISAHARAAILPLAGGGIPAASLSREQSPVASTAFATPSASAVSAGDRARDGTGDGFEHGYGGALSAATAAARAGAAAAAIRVPPSATAAGADDRYRRGVSPHSSSSPSGASFPASDTRGAGVSPASSDGSPFAFIPSASSPAHQLPGLAVLARQLPGLSSSSPAPAHNVRAEFVPHSRDGFLGRLPPPAPAPRFEFDVDGLRTRFAAAAGHGHGHGRAHAHAAAGAADFEYEYAGAPARWQSSGMRA